MFSLLKNIFSSNKKTLLEEKNNWDILVKDLSQLSSDRNFLVKESQIAKANADNALSSTEDKYIVKAVTEKYNNYFSDWLRKSEDVEIKIKLVEKEKDEALKQSSDLKALVNGLNKIDKLKQEETYKYEALIKKYSINRKRETLPQIDANNYEDIIKHFEDKVKVTKTKIALKNLKPVQDELNHEKVLNIMKDILYGNKEIKFFISNDNYFCDGHHTWAGGLEVDENLSVDCFRIDLSIGELLRRLNIMKVTTKADQQDNEIKKSFEIVVAGYLTQKVPQKQFDEIIIKAEQELGGRYHIDRTTYAFMGMKDLTKAIVVVKEEENIVEEVVEEEVIERKPRNRSGKGKRKKR